MVPVLRPMPMSFSVARVVVVMLLLFILHISHRGRPPVSVVVLGILLLVYGCSMVGGSAGSRA